MHTLLLTRWLKAENGSSLCSYCEEYLLTAASSSLPLVPCAPKQKWSRFFTLKAQRHLPTIQLSIFQLFSNISTTNNTLKFGFKLQRRKLPLTGSSGETWFSRTISRYPSVGCPLHFVRHWSVVGYDAVATTTNRGYNSFKNVFYSTDTMFEISQRSVFLLSRKHKTSRTDSFPLWSTLLAFDFPRLSTVTWPFQKASSLRASPLLSCAFLCLDASTVDHRLKLFFEVIW